jgi:hypothetical protein
MHARMIAFYTVGLSMKTLRNAEFVDLINSIIEKTMVMTRTATEIEKNVGLKGVLYFPIISRLKHWFANKVSELLR